MRLTLTALLILWVLLLPSLGFSQELKCPGLSNVEVSSDDKENIVEICLAARHDYFSIPLQFEPSVQNPL